jgi:hypothetical protein
MPCSVFYRSFISINIIPSYQVTSSRVLANFISSIIKTDGDVSLLHAFESGWRPNPPSNASRQTPNLLNQTEHTSDQPSWVPNLADASKLERFEQRSVSPTITSLVRFGTRDVTSERGILRLSGVLIGYLTFLRPRC